MVNVGEPNGEMPMQPEQELKEPTLEQWAETYAEMSGDDKEKILEAAQSLLKEKANEIKEVFGDDPIMLIYGKNGETTVTAWERIKSENLAKGLINPEGIKTNGETSKAFVAFARFSQEADENSLGENPKSAKDWEKTGETFMSPKQAMIAREAYRSLTGKQMDERYITMSPGFRSGFGNVPYLFFNSGYGKVILHGVGSGVRDHIVGVRRVVSKEF